ncbi:MAG: hypothetical protein WAO31_03240, partial [Rhodoluna sp.]
MAGSTDVSDPKSSNAGSHESPSPEMVSVSGLSPEAERDRQGRSGSTFRPSTSATLRSTPRPNGPLIDTSNRPTMG